MVRGQGRECNQTEKQRSGPTAQPVLLAWRLRRALFRSVKMACHPLFRSTNMNYVLIISQALGIKCWADFKEPFLEGTTSCPLNRHIYNLVNALTGIIIGRYVLQTWGTGEVPNGSLEDICLSWILMEQWGLISLQWHWRGRERAPQTEIPACKKTQSHRKPTWVWVQ